MGGLPLGGGLRVPSSKVYRIPQWRRSLKTCLADAFELCDHLYVMCEFEWMQVRIINHLSSLSNLNFSSRLPSVSLMLNINYFRVLRSQKTNFIKKLEYQWINLTQMIPKCVQLNGMTIRMKIDVNYTLLPTHTLHSLPVF